LTSAPPPSRASRIQIVEPKSVPKLGGKAARTAGGRWTIQVGTFKSRSDAREQLAIVEKKFGQHVDDARGSAEKDGRKYKARFEGLTEADAKDACRALKAKKHPCMVVGPQG
jgi:D-alanyl-D-alanine carboxypeptidase (penicillin-binding protein 5/6)